MRCNIYLPLVFVLSMSLVGHLDCSCMFHTNAAFLGSSHGDASNHWPRHEAEESKRDEKYSDDSRMKEKEQLKPID